MALKQPTPPDEQPRRPRGCEECANTGYVQGYMLASYGRDGPRYERLTREQYLDLLCEVPAEQAGRPLKPGEKPMPRAGKIDWNSQKLYDSCPVPCVCALGQFVRLKHRKPPASEQPDVKAMAVGA